MNRVKASPLLKEISLLYIEDESDVRDVFVTLIKPHLREVYVASNGKEGLELFFKHKTDIVITDIRMPDMDGLSLAEGIKEVSPETPVIFVTAFSDVDYLMRALEIGAEGYITKPVSMNALYTKLNFLAETIINKRKLNEYVNILRTLLDEYADPVVLLEGEDIKLYNVAFSEVFGDIKHLSQLKERVSATRECEDFNLDKEKTVICVEQEGSTYYYEVDVRTIGMYKILYFVDITSFRREILVDELTGVYNRKYLKILKRNLVGKHVCIAMCDIDNFKKINDAYGHKKGDEILGKVTGVFKSLLRRADVVIRYGGEEFLIYLSGVEDCDTAYTVIEGLRKNIHTIKIEGKPMSCSFGIACGNVSKERDIEVLITKADTALYTAKSNGKDRTEIYRE